MITRNRATAFDALVDLSREMDRLATSSWTERANGNHTQAVMPTEIIENEEGIRFDVEVAGIRPEDIEITLENGILSITADRKLDRADKQKDEDYRLFERRYGRFQRSFALPPAVRADLCAATCEHGVLTIRLPRAEEARPRRIRVDVGGNSRRIEESQTEQ